jgi:hypothetical protein
MPLASLLIWAGLIFVCLFAFVLIRVLFRLVFRLRLRLILRLIYVLWLISDLRRQLVSPPFLNST